MIGSQLARFAIMAGVSKPYLFNSSPGLLLKVKDFLECLANSRNQYWRTENSDTLNIVESGEGYFVIPRKSPSRFDGINVPFNYQNKYGYFLLKLWLLTGESTYLEMASSIGNTFVRHLDEFEEGYKWNYWWGVGYSGWTEDNDYSDNTPSSPGTTSLASSSYAGIDLEFVVELMKYSDVITSNVTERIISTYLLDSMNFDNVSAGLLLAPFSSDASDKAKKLSRPLAIQFRYLPLIAKLIEKDGSPWGLSVIDRSIEGHEKVQVSNISRDFVSYELLTQGGVLLVNKNDLNGYSLELTVIESGELQ